MAPKKPPVTTKALQALLTRIGSATSGTKAILQDRFARDVYKSSLFARRPDRQARQNKDKGRKLRIMSIDMGIKNLAYCDVEVEYSSKSNFNTTMEILRWEKVDLIKTTRGSRPQSPSPKDVKSGTTDEDEDADPYSLSVLSTTAYELVKDTILAGAPDVILIEKQRWRSGGGSAILQWTVRINTFEGMLWAVLETLRSERKATLPRVKETVGKRDFEIFGVDPKRVGHYWLGQNARALAERHGRAGDTTSAPDEESFDEENEATTKKKVSRTKAEKKAKIAILRSWLASPASSTAPSTRKAGSTITFQVSGSAESTRQALCSPSKPTRRKKQKSKAINEEQIESVAVEDVPDSELKKLDDVTDCLLQTAAWVSWESNRLQLQAVRNKTSGDAASLPELSEEALLAMVTGLGEG